MQDQLQNQRSWYGIVGLGLAYRVLVKKTTTQTQLLLNEAYADQALRQRLEWLRV